MYYNLTVFAVFAFLYSAIAGGVSRTIISGPMLFTAFRLIFGPLGLGIFTPDIYDQTLRRLADLTLACFWPGSAREDLPVSSLLSSY